MDSLAGAVLPILEKGPIAGVDAVPSSWACSDETASPSAVEKNEKGSSTLDRLPPLPKPSSEHSDLIDLRDTDAVLAAKLKLVNDAIDHIGWVRYHTLLFFLCGFGYLTDSMLILLPSTLYNNVVLEFPQHGFPRWMQIGIYIGLLSGAVLFGIGTDAKGRRWIFNLSLISCALFTVLSGVAPNYPVLVVFTGLACFGGGGNLILDTTIFCEFCPSKHQWTITLLALFWGVGQLLAVSVSWVFVANFSCDPTGPCARKDNMGWRYTCYTLGGLVTLMSIARVSVLRLHETPKWLVAQGRDDDAVGSLNYIANRYGKPNYLTRGHLRYLGEINDVRNHNLGLFRSIVTHTKGLFVTRKLAWSTIGVWILWALIGIAYPIFNIFLPAFLASFSPQPPSEHRIFANYTITNACSIVGPIFAAALCAQAKIGRRRTMAIGAVLTAIFMFVWTNAKTPYENAGFPATVAITLNLFYGCLYGYTAEVLPAASRATGTGLAVTLNRIGGIAAIFIAVYGSSSHSSAPIYVAAALFLVMAGVALVLPFEPQSKRPV